MVLVVRAVSAPTRPTPATNLAHCSAILSAIVFLRRLQILALLCPMAAALGQEVGSKAWGACHAAIYRSYSATGMSRSSGKAGAAQFRESFDRADFTDAISGVGYRVSPSPDGYRLQFARGDSDVRGQRLLTW